jgi:hypothetical protein
MANAIYRARQSSVSFLSPAPGNPNDGALLTMASLATNAGRYSSQFSRGILGAAEYEGYATIKLAVAAALGATATIYAISSNGTIRDGGLGATDAALTADKRRNLVPVGIIVADAATVGPFTGKISSFLAFDQYLSMAIYNEMGQALTAVAADHSIVIYPSYWEIQ